jgi:hypothetical protein
VIFVLYLMSIRPCSGELGVDECSCGEMIVLVENLELIRRHEAV